MGHVPRPAGTLSRRPLNPDWVADGDTHLEFPSDSDWDTSMYHIQKDDGILILAYYFD